MYISSGMNSMTSVAYEGEDAASHQHWASAKTWMYGTTARDLCIVPSVFTAAPSLLPSYSVTFFAGSKSEIGIESGHTSGGSPSPRTNSTPAAQLYECPQPDCSRKFSRRYSLTEHAKTHFSGEKPHVCPVRTCNKRFSTSGNLSRHKRLHGYIDPLQCPVEGCRSTFPSNNKLDKHMRYHLGSPVHVCKIGSCGKTFSTMGNLNRHIKHHHHGHGSEQVDPDSDRGSFASTTSRSRRRSSSVTSYQYQPVQSPTATDDLYSSSRERVLSRELHVPDPSSDSASMIAFPRIHPATVSTLGDAERAWSHDTILDSITSIFDEDTASHASGAQLSTTPQEHFRHHAQYHYETAYSHQQQYRYPSSHSNSGPVAAESEASPADARLLDDMIHFHVTNFQC